MFTVELKINGSMIGHIYGHNEGVRASDAEGDRYRYEYYRPETRRVHNGEITHVRSEGIEKLVALILMDVENK